MLERNRTPYVIRSTILGDGFNVNLFLQKEQLERKLTALFVLKVSYAIENAIFNIDT